MLGRAEGEKAEHARKVSSRITKGRDLTAEEWRQVVT